MDSPNGREVTQQNVAEVMAIVAEDFKKHQVIIASIYNSYDFADKNIIERKDRLPPFQKCAPSANAGDAPFVMKRHLKSLREGDVFRMWVSSRLLRPFFLFVLRKL